MRATGVMVFGGPEALQIVDVPAEPLGPGQVRLRVSAAAVNPTDTYTRSRCLRRPRPGQDAAVGAGHGRRRRSSPSWATASTTWPSATSRWASSSRSARTAATARTRCCPGNSVVRAPAGTDAVAASTLPMNGLTARLALDLMALRPGQVLAVTGAAGAFGGYVVQLAKADGLTVVADASEADEELVRGLGADVVVRRGDDVAARIREHFPDGRRRPGRRVGAGRAGAARGAGRRRGGDGPRLPRRRAARPAVLPDPGPPGGRGPRRRWTGCGSRSRTAS